MTSAIAGELTVLLGGDIVLDEPDAPYWLSGVAPAVRAADLAIGHLEVPHTRRGVEMDDDVPAPGAPPENLAALAECGFAMLSLAGNHIADRGTEGIADTISELDRLGIAHAGAGADIAEARRPAIVERNGRRVALLSYNCVGPEASWAGPRKAGCAWLRVETADGAPIAPAARLDRLAEGAIETLREHIGAARAQADIVIVSLHKGIVHRPAVLAPYERAVAHAAIESGADAVASHHAHIARGIEFHRGRPVFHGLGNCCVVTRALSPDQDHPARREWARRRTELFGFAPDPAYSLAPFHPEAVNAFFGRLVWGADGALRAGIVPVYVEAPGRPMLAQGERAVEICRYVEEITRAAGLPPIAISADGMAAAA